MYGGDDRRNPSGDPGAALRRLAGHVIVAVGVLWTVLSGACTAIFLVEVIPGAMRGARPGDIAMLLAIILIPGVISTVVGLGIVVGGRAMAGLGKDGKVDHSTFD